MNCYNCGKPAMWAIGPEGEQAALCLDCYAKFVNASYQKQIMLERQVNYLTAEMDYVTGLSGVAPAFPPAPPAITVEGTTLNNIHVTNSEIGVINTGSIGTLDSAVTVIKSEGNSELAAAVVSLTEAVLESNQIAAEQKNEIVELLGALSEQASAPSGQRKTGVARALLSRLSDIMQTVVVLSGVWDKAHRLFEMVFAG